MSTAKAKKTPVKIEASAPALQFVPLHLIVTAPQIRKEFNQESIEELAADIKARGMLQPVLLTPTADGKYMMIAGERRLRAARFAELESIPALVGQIAPHESYLMQLAENIHREDLDMSEQCDAVEILYKSLGNMKAVSEAVKKSLPWCSKRYAMSKTDLHYHAKQLLEDNITEDLELLNAFSTYCKTGNWRQTQDMNEKIRKGEAGRTEIRDALKALKADLKKERLAAEDNEKVSHAKVRTPPPPPVWTIQNALDDLSQAISYTDNDLSAKQLMETYTADQVQEVHQKLIEARRIGGTPEGYKTIAKLIINGVYQSDYNDIELLAMIWGQSNRVFDINQFWEALQCPRETDPE
jgi:ParB/RepB/Spo0J family partition protein